MESLREAEVRGVVTIKSMKKLWKMFQESDLAEDQHHPRVFGQH